MPHRAARRVPAGLPDTGVGGAGGITAEMAATTAGLQPGQALSPVVNVGREQVVAVPLPPCGSFGALVRALRHRAYLSQEQLAARAELSERTVRNLEAGRVRSPRTTTVRLLADALELAEPERKSWLAAAREANRQPEEPGPPGAGGPAQVPGRVTVALLTGDA